MNRRHFVAGDQHAADQREAGGCLCVRRQSEQQQNAEDEDRCARGFPWSHAKIPSGSKRPLSTAAVSS